MVKTNPTVHHDYFKNVEMLIGDRDNNLEALKGRKWDAVIDNSGHRVKWTQDTAELLKDNCGLYLYTSSTGVYYPYLGKDIKEDTKLLTEEPKEVEHEYEKMEYWYGVMKTNSELAAQNAFGKDRTIIVRPTYMVGPADKLDRFIHWPIRFGQGGEIMVPGKKDDPVQFIDVRDVAEFMIRLIEEKNTDSFNAVGPKDKMGMHEFIEKASAPFEKESKFVYIDDYDFLKENKCEYIVPWIMPEGNNQGTALINNQKAIANGMTFRPLDKTMLDTYEWWNGLTEERRQKFEMKEDSTFVREREILEAWKAKEVKSD